MVGIDRRVPEILPHQASPKIGLFRVLLCLCFKTSLSANTNLSYENEFCMQFHFHANQSHFHKNGFALRLALKQRHKGTRKWPEMAYYLGSSILIANALEHKIRRAWERAKRTKTSGVANPSYRTTTVLLSFAQTKS